MAISPGPAVAGRTVSASLLCALLLLLSAVSAQVAVLGIDIGTEFAKSALVRPGTPFDVILSKDGKRKEPSSISFKPGVSPNLGSEALPQRFFGTDALSLQSRFPESSFSNLKNILGLPLEDEQVSSFLRRSPALKATAAPETGTVAFQEFIRDSAEEITTEELLAMQLANIKNNAQLAAGDVRVRQTVFTVPPYFSVDERRSLLTAAELAGLDAVGVISDGAAIALHYATSRTLPNTDKGESPEHHLVFDIGSGSTSATLATFEVKGDAGKGGKGGSPRVSVISTGWDRSLGGDALTEIIVSDMIQALVKLPGAVSKGLTVEDVWKNGKAVAKLRRDAIKLRHVLSANTQAFSVTENVIPGIDFRYSLTRADFEEKASTFTDKIGGPINEALAKGKLEPKDITSVILHGGVTRTPFVLKKLESIFGASKIKNTVNSDEGAALGAAFRAAQLNPILRVKDVQCTDVSNRDFSISVTTAAGQTESLPLFNSDTPVGTTREFVYPASQDISIELFEQLSSGKQVSVSTTKPKDFNKVAQTITKDHGCTPEESKIKIVVQLSQHLALPQVSSISIGCEVDEKGSIIKRTLRRLTNLLPNDQWTNEYSDSSSEAPAEKKMKQVELPLKYSVAPEPFSRFSRQTTSQLKKRIARFDRSDALHNSHSDLLNELESHIVESRTILEDEEQMSIYSTPEEVGTINAIIETVSDWLMEEGSDSSLSSLKARQAQIVEAMKPISDKIKAAKEELQRAEAARKKLETTRNDFKAILDQTGEMIKFVHESAGSGSSDELAKQLGLTPYTPDEIVTLEKLHAENSAWVAAETADKPYTVEEYQERVRIISNESTSLLQKKIKDAEDARKAREQEAKAKEDASKEGSAEGAEKPAEDPKTADAPKDMRDEL